jgi:hypothetical protein
MDDEGDREIDLKRAHGTGIARLENGQKRAVSETHRRKSSGKEWEHPLAGDLAPIQALACVILLLECDKFGVGRGVAGEPSVDLLIDRCAADGSPQTREEGERVQDGDVHA